MRRLAKSDLGATVFFASSHPSESCGSNGLPLTPNSIKILGRFQFLKTISHRHICKYVHIARGKQERLIVVSEHHKRNAKDTFRKSYLLNDPGRILKFAHQVCQGLAHLHALGIVHRCLSSENILLDDEDNVKLSHYGLYYATDCGACVSFPIGDPKYIAPEVLAGGMLKPSDPTFGIVGPSSGPNVDTWALGCVLLEIVLGYDLHDSETLEEYFKKYLSMIEANLKNSEESMLSAFGAEYGFQSKLAGVDDDILSIIEACLTLSPSKRPTPKELLKLPIFEPQNFDMNSIEPIRDSFPSIRLSCALLEVPSILKDEDIDFIAERPLEEVFYLWQLAGGDLEAELKRHGMIKTKNPICSLPKIIVEEGEMFGQKKDLSLLFDSAVVTLSLDQLRHRLSNLPPESFYPLTESRSVNIPNTQSIVDLTETAQLPLVIKEKDIEYQLHRIVLFQRLLEGYPYKRAHIMKEAKVDVPPLYRALIWAALLDAEGDILWKYDIIDKETFTATDRQIEVDIPRCHQYDELLSSPEGHRKFKRILKAWVVNHPEYVYWQGLDSLCAPFLYLNFNDEALAYECFSAFIDKYLHQFFLKDNSPVIQEYLAVFAHLIAFHNPELANHLNNIGFIPELYAIPWFLTMFTHVFPLHKIFHLWDTLLLGNPSFPLCVGVAILKQLSDDLLSFGFNECILLFSDMPEIDIERCVQESIRIFCCTPKSATYRQYERPFGGKQVVVAHHNATGIGCNHPSDQSMDPIPLETLKSELCPHIAADDLLELLDMTNASLRTTSNKVKPRKLLVVDVRSPDEFVRGALPDSINIPFQTAFTSEGTLNTCPEVSTLLSNRGKLIVIVGKQGNNQTNFADQLVNLGFPRVCTLHKGIDVLRHAGTLVVPSAQV